ncbi:MAG: hypothetical protein WBX22_29615 [Silvibacterium sp.]
MLDIDSFLAFKSASEEKWARRSIKDTVWGFQIQAQTRWNPGLTDDAIAQYEEAIDSSFHPDFKAFLKCMNGTDIPAIDVRGTSGETTTFRARIVFVSPRPRIGQKSHRGGQHRQSSVGCHA